jgi:hypothetical protein
MLDAKRAEVARVRGGDYNVANLLHFFTQLVIGLKPLIEGVDGLPQSEVQGVLTEGLKGVGWLAAGNTFDPNCAEMPTQIQVSAH